MLVLAFLSFRRKVKTCHQCHQTLSLFDGFSYSDLVLSGSQRKLLLRLIDINSQRATCKVMEQGMPVWKSELEMLCTKQTTAM